MKSLYGNFKAAETKPKAAAPRTPDRRPIFGGSGETGSIDLSLSNYYSKRHAALRDDKERLEHSRAEERALKAFCQRRGLNAADVHTVLTVLNEHESRPRPALKTNEERAAASARTLEALRKAVGSEPAAIRTWERATVGAKVLNQEITSLASRAQSTGAITDHRVLQFLAAVADSPPPPKEAA